MEKVLLFISLIISIRGFFFFCVLHLCCLCPVLLICWMDIYCLFVSVCVCNTFVHVSALLASLPGPYGTAAARPHPNRQSRYETGRSEGVGKLIPRHYLRPGVHKPGRHLAAHSDGREWHRVSEPSPKLAILNILFIFSCAYAAGLTLLSHTARPTDLYCYFMNKYSVGGGDYWSALAARKRFWGLESRSEFTIERKYWGHILLFQSSLYFSMRFCSREAQCGLA